MSKFVHPRLSRRDIAGLLVNTGIASVSENQLVNPSSDFICDIYSRLLMQLGSLSEESNGLVDFSILEKLENPEIHMDSVPVENLFHRVKEVLARLDCPVDLVLKDLLMPQSDRAEWFLSALLNFNLHKDAKMDYLRPVVDELNILEERKGEVEDKISQLNVEVAFHNEARERELPFIQELDAKVKELHQMVASLNNEQMSLRATLRKLKEEVEELDDKISSAEYSLIQSAEENANLLSKIVQSPEKLQRALEEKKVAREGAADAEMLAEQSVEEKNATLELCSKVLKKFSKQYQQMEAILDQLNASKSTEKELKAIKVKLSDEGMMDKSLEAKVVERQGKAQQLDDLKQQLEKEKNMKFEEASKGLHNVEMTVESQRCALKARQRKVEALVAEVDALALETNSVKEVGAAKVQQILNKCEEITNEYDGYVESINAFIPMYDIAARS